MGKIKIKLLVKGKEKLYTNKADVMRIIRYRISRQTNLFNMDDIQGYAIRSWLTKIDIIKKSRTCFKQYDFLSEIFKYPCNKTYYRKKDIYQNKRNRYIHTRNDVYIDLHWILANYSWCKAVSIACDITKSPRSMGRFTLIELIQETLLKKYKQEIIKYCKEHYNI